MRKLIGLILVLVPLAALAQTTGVGSVPTEITIPTTGGEWLGLALKTIVLPLVIMAGKLLWSWIETRKQGDAVGRILAAIDVIGQPIWDRHVAELGVALADGRLDPEERARLVASIEEELPQLMSRQTLEVAVKALGLPNLAGLSSWILSRLLARWRGAHDPLDPTVPNGVAGVYPVVRVSNIPPEGGLQPDSPG